MEAPPCLGSALAQPWIILREIAATHAELLLRGVTLGEGHVSATGGCSPGRLCGQWATGRKVEQGQAVCQHLGMSSEPWKQLPCVLPAAAEALLSMEGLLGELLVP